MVAKVMASGATVAADIDRFERQRASVALKKLDLSLIYDADPRPTFIVDSFLSNRSGRLVFSYSNPALNERRDLISIVHAIHGPNTDFYRWAITPHQDEHHYWYGDALWFSFMIQDRWAVIATASLPPITDGVLHISKTPDNNYPTNHSEEELASLEASIRSLREEIRLLEFGRKQAAKEKQSCWAAVQRLKEELRSLEGTTPKIKESRFTSLDSGSTAAVQIQHPRKDEPEANDASQNLTSNSSTRRLSSNLLTQSNAKVVLPLRVTEKGEGDASMALEKFQRLAEAVDVGFFDYDPTGKLLHANESWYALSGHPRDPKQHTALSFAKCVHPEDSELVMDQWSQLMKGQAVTFEMRWRKPSLLTAAPDAPCEAQWVLAACVPVIGADGEVKSISGCTTDINAQKQSAEVALQRAEALERARASEERFARFGEVAPIAIFRFDKHKNIEYCNDRWFEMTGITRSRFEEITWPFGVHEEDIEMCSQAWEKSISDRSIGQIEFRLQKKWHDAHGRRGQTWVYCTFFPEFAEDGSFNGLMGSLLDISHLKWAENMQKSRAEDALEAKRQQETFIDITSHEMRNPLSAMVQCADAILTSITDISKITEASSPARSAQEDALLQENIDTGLDAVQTILSCAAHQKRIVDDILTLSKLDSNLLLITPVKTNPIDMVHGILKMFEMDANKAEITLTHELSPSFQDLHIDWLMLDPSRVSQILINLLGNAIKFTTSESIKRVTVRMSASLEPASRSDRDIEYVPTESIIDDLYNDTDKHGPVYLKFEVQDTGRGLTPEEKEKLFLRFSQASPKTHVQYGGSGLGLFISRKLTEMQGGEIGFASEADIGSTFAFYVKARRTTPPDIDSNPGTPKRSNETQLITSDPDNKRNLNVLLVEDNLVNQKVLGKQLERQGCNVFIAGHGIEALNFLRTTKSWSKPLSPGGSQPASEPVSIDVVLMDIEMPVMGGLECTKKIRELEQAKEITKHIPIISISANARSQQVDEARVAGVDDTITKPFRIQELMPKVNRLAGSRI